MTRNTQPKPYFARRRTLSGVAQCTPSRTTQEQVEEGQAAGWVRDKKVRRETHRNKRRQHQPSLNSLPVLEKERREDDKV